MKKNIIRAEKLTAELGDIFNSLVKESKEFDLTRLLKQLEADMMDIRHKLSLASKIIDKNSK
ncbi:MAG: hypothetical protein J7K40_15530 [candidate division Zixibacteria bacterium]|nr:hypothetical protein [candidate division Zixibacteria bacterium]